MTDGPEPKIASVTDVGGPCEPPLVKLLPVGQESPVPPQVSIDITSICAPAPK